MSEHEPEHRPDPAGTQRNGPLVIIGGGEDRKHDMQILARFVEPAA